MPATMLAGGQGLKIFSAIVEGISILVVNNPAVVWAECLCIEIAGRPAYQSLCGPLEFCEGGGSSTKGGLGISPGGLVFSCPQTNGG